MASPEAEERKGALAEGLQSARSDNADFYRSCPFGEDLAGDIGHVAGRLPHALAKRLLGPLVPRVCEPVSMFGTLGLTSGLLQAAFAKPFSGGVLSDRERAALAALYFCDDIWTVSNNVSTFKAFGLPGQRSAVGQLLGLALEDAAGGKALFEKAVATARQEGPAAALPLCEEALRLGPHIARAWANVGWALRESGRGVEAAAMFRRGIEVFGYDQPLYSELALTLMLVGQHQAAVNAATEWLDYQTDALFFYNRACALAQLGNTDLAIGDITLAVELDPSFYADLAGDSDLASLRAHPDFQRVLASAPQDSST